MYFVIAKDNKVVLCNKIVYYYYYYHFLLFMRHVLDQTLLLGLMLTIL